jgi:uncharacterized protein
MKIAFHLAHPAHFHLFKHVAKNLIELGHKVLITYNDKDVLSSLVQKSELAGYSKRITALKNVNSNFRLKIQFVQKNIGIFFKYLWFKPDLVLGTSVIISLVGRSLRYKSIIVNEDDFDIVQKTVDLGYPYANNIICPTVCRTGLFTEKCVQYEGYHELAYLHPNHFTPNKSIVEKYFSSSEPFFIIRFAKLKAHHDDGVRGISIDIAKEIVSLLSPFGKVYITSERTIEKELNKFRINIDPIDMHHVMAYAQMYIGDSQTMAAEAGVLGVPFIRFNDFVGRIGYLKELEEKYELGYGIIPTNPELLFVKIKELLDIKDRTLVFQKRRKKMLDDKIDYSKFLTWFIINYPISIETLKLNPDYQYNFK